MACDCSTDRYAYVPKSGLGEIDLGAFGSVLSLAQAAWDQLLSALGVGAGRKEADIIVPIQNKVVSDIIAPIFAFDDAVLNHNQPVDCNEARLFLSSVTSAEQQWLNYLHLTKWVDGRAAQQAEATLAPYFTKCKGDLNTIIATKCSSVVGSVGDVIGNTVGNILKTSTGETNWPVIGIGVAVAFMFLRKK
jgi:hypothetical protein